MKASFGDELSPYAVEKIKLAEGQKIIVSVISLTILITKGHYLKGVGAFHCFDGKCCQDCGLPNVRYCLPCYIYKSDGEFKITSKKLDFKMLVRGNDDYQSLLTKNQILKQSGSSILDKMLLVTCQEAGYQRYDFDILGDAMWKEFIENKERYKEDMTRFVQQGELTMGRRLANEEAYIKMLDFAEDKPVTDRPQAGVQVALTDTKSPPAQLEDNSFTEIDLESKKPAGQTTVMTEEPDKSKDIVLDDDDFEALLEED